MKKQREIIHEGPDFETGAPVLIVRPNVLWSGCVGTVISQSKHLHVLRVVGKNGEHFRADVPGSQLRHWPWKVSGRVVEQ